MKFRLLILLTFVSFLAIAVNAQSNSKAMKDATETVNEASKVIREIMRAEDKAIPRDLLQNAQAVVVFPGAIKGAFIVGAQGGKGLAIRRVGKGWSAPAFLNMAGGSFGFQIGGSKTDYVLLIMNDEGLRELLKDKFEVGGEGSVAAGPVGRTAAASTNATFDTGILTYSRSKGLFAGISLKGVVISNDDDVNGPIYHKTAKMIIGQPPVAASSAPAPLRSFGTTVATYAR